MADPVQAEGAGNRPVVVLAAGGTAGHVNPMLALAHELQDRATLRVLGTAEGLEAELVPAAGLDLTTLERVPIPRRPTPQWFTLPGRWRRARGVAREVIRGADVVVGFGGYVSAPAYSAARSLGVPVVVHEQNSRPGLANRWGARYATRVAVTFPGTPLARGELVGLPLREPIAELIRARALDRDSAAAAGARALGLDPQRPVLLVTGGSLGAARLNSVVPQVAPALVAAGVQVLHLTGRGKDAPVRAAIEGLPPGYHVREYLRQMQHALACADLVIARAGAGTVSELSALGIPAIYVPLPIGNGEQALNAEPVVQAGGALLVADAALSAEWLEDHLLPLMTDPPQRAQMAQAAAGSGITDGAATLAGIVREVLAERVR